ncbi:hypothetical protein [Vagococcus sp. CY52-2]|uniref:hypothetical protein n=1 Tax=Vagococcus sp. CY52-2 TaxID=2925838 RepID=UPI001F5A1E61|nr:hypothetical protein [Vagococcus sp. CY52-2]UNM90545.1 hypothetical protein MN187_10245 [Vagococcus sp. CY52-2]UNM90600.1 hypothetical protein MN187_09945 [Vagococcus sp. CY52-2]
MDLQETVDMHTKKLEQHDKALIELREQNAKEIESIKSDIRSWSVTLSEGLARVDESSKYLREQNSNILNEIIGRNNKSDERNHEMDKIKWQSILKICLAIFGSGGFIYTVVDLILNTIK